MKCFVSVLALIGAAAAAPQYIADTPEVQEAKVAFANAFNQAARGSAVALQQAGPVVSDPKDPDFAPAAEPYVHVEVPAEPYVHIEPICDRTGKCDGAAPAPKAAAPAPFRPAPAQFRPAPVQQAAAPVQPTAAAPVGFNPFQPFSFNGQAVQPAAAVYANNGAVINPFSHQLPQQPATFAAPATFAGTCYNHKGEGVPCYKTTA